MGIFDALKNRALNTVNEHVQKIAQDARDNISGYSSRGLESDSPETTAISEAIHVDQARFEGLTIVASVWVDLEQAPAAIAYEYGSGLQGDEGEEYPITTVKHDEMIFEWFPPRPNPNLPWKVMYEEDGSGGIVGFDSGWTLRHPGVEEKSFMRNALSANRGLVIKALGKVGVVSAGAFFRDKYGREIVIQ